MHSVRVASSSPLLQRTCLSCGYRGEELQRSGDRVAYRCPACGQDLYARPPKSYAEMEGLRVQLVPSARTAATSAPAPRRVGAPRAGLLSRMLRAVLKRLGLIKVRKIGGAPVSPQVRHGPAAPRR